LIGGKGGVGKTTCAAAIAVHAAATGARVLVASTDPAPSLGDALKVPLAPNPRRVKLPNHRLAAVEIDARHSLDRWLAGRKGLLEEIAVQGTWLERDDVVRLLRLSLPGIDEIAALLEISTLADSRQLDLVVVDTAPTGHALRMLAMPDALAAVSAVFHRMREKRRIMEEALRGESRRSAEDALIEEIAGTARGLSQLLRDPRRTRVSWVTLAEPMAVVETADAVEALKAGGIDVSSIIVNGLTRAPGSPCGHCDARRALERQAIRTLPRVESVAGVHARDLEPRGFQALRSIGREIARHDLGPRRPVRAPSWRALLDGPAAAPDGLVPDLVRLVLFGGKGGVGKTTCAATMALAAADRDRSKRVLLVSTDPAHSLADVFGQPVSDNARALLAGPANLSVREIDPAAFLSRIRERYINAVDTMFGAADRGFDIAHDRAVMKSLIDLAPPGLDEVAAVLEVSDALIADPRRWDVVIMDTAPTGHALRLLQTPALIHDWTRELMRILLKYQKVTGLGELAQSLLTLASSVRRLRVLLADPDRCAFVVVTRAAALPRLETVRLMRSLDELDVHVPAVVVNAAGRGTCRRCRKNRAAEKREINAIRRASLRAGTRNIVTTAAAVPPPHGVAALRRWGGRCWRSTTGYHQHR
jgi:arsenite/tail-anchored protein-transporting ATPase